MLNADTHSGILEAKAFHSTMRVHVRVDAGFTAMRPARVAIRIVKLPDTAVTLGHAVFRL